MVACARRSYAAAAGGGGAKTKAASGASGGAETDVVKRVFSEQQQKFRALLEKSKTLSPPVGGDATAVKAYAAKKLAILKEVRSDDAPRDDARSGTTSAVVGTARSISKLCRKTDRHQAFARITVASPEIVAGHRRAYAGRRRLKFLGR